MKKPSKKKARNKRKNILGVFVAAAVSVLLLNPGWLPLSAETKGAVAELEKTHFLIERSGHITLAHLLTLVLALCLLWLFYTLVRLILNAVGD